MNHKMLIFILIRKILQSMGVYNKVIIIIMRLIIVFMSNSFISDLLLKRRSWKYIF